MNRVEIGGQGAKVRFEPIVEATVFAAFARSRVCAAWRQNLSPWRSLTTAGSRLAQQIPGSDNPSRTTQLFLIRLVMSASDACKSISVDA